MRTTRTLLTLPALLVAGAAGCGGSDDSSSAPKKKQQKAPAKTHGTAPTKTQAAGSPSGGGRTVPVKVLRGQGAVKAYAQVTIKGRKLAMVVDTGASQTTIDERVAKKLGLPAKGAARTQSNLGCKSTAQPVAISDWKAGGVPLPDGIVVSKKVDLYDKSKGKIVGLLGSDALASFGSMRLDYEAQRLTLGGPAPVGAQSFPVKVITKRGNVIVAAKLSLRGKAGAFVLDTGAGKTTIDLKAAKQLGLKSVGKPTKVLAVSCTTTVQPVRIDDWKVGGVKLPPTIALGSNSTLRKLGITGLVGSDVFSHYGTFYVDFKGQKAALK